MVTRTNLWRSPSRRPVSRRSPWRGTLCRAGRSVRAIAVGAILVGSAIPAATAGGQARTATVRGRVVDAVTAVPIEGASVFLLGIRRPQVSDPSGHFAHRQLDLASYLMQVTKEGYVTMTWEVVAADDTTVVHVLELVPLPAGPAEPAPPSGRPGDATVRGRVVDQETKTPITGAEVAVVGRATPTTTDGNGRFRLTRLASTRHTLQVRKIGYDAVALTVTATQDGTVEEVIQLPRSMVPLMDTVVIADSARSPEGYWHVDFERRRATGRGQFVTRQEILQRNAYSVGDLLRTLNGLRMHCRLSGCAVWMTRANCRPAYFVDGFPVDATTAERMPVNDVFGVEVYDLFEVPVGLQMADLECGVIAMWTRRGPPPRR